MKKNVAKTVANTLTSFLKADANSNSCVIVHQPKAPKGLERFKNNK